MMNPAIMRQQQNRNVTRTMGAIDWNGIIQVVAQGASTIAQSVTTRQQAEAARTELQQYYVNAFYTQIAPLAEHCQIPAVEVVNTLIGEFEQKCSSIPHAATAASCGNISSEMRSVWLVHARNWDAACVASGQTATQQTQTATGSNSVPQTIANNAPSVSPSFDLGLGSSNLLPIAVLAIGAFLLLKS